MQAMNDSLISHSCNHQAWQSGSMCSTIPRPPKYGAKVTSPEKASGSAANGINPRLEMEQGSTVSYWAPLGGRQVSVCGCLIQTRDGGVWRDPVETAAAGTLIIPIEQLSYSSLSEHQGMSFSMRGRCVCWRFMDLTDNWDETLPVLCYFIDFTMTGIGHITSLYSK